jgi:CheY-like chemotaxis protein
MTVLIVDPNLSLRRQIRTVLEREGHETLEAEDGLEALLRAASHSRPIDLLLTGLDLKGIDAGRLAEKFTHPFPTAKVIFLPIDPDALLETVHSLSPLRKEPARAAGAGASAQKTA